MQLNTILLLVLNNTNNANYWCPTDNRIGADISGIGKYL